MAVSSYDVNTQDFEQKVLELSRRVPVLVDFWAEWCAPCRALGPVLEKLAAEYGGRFLLAKINSDENQALAMQLGVRGIPNCKLFADGKLVDEFVGALPEAQLRDFLDRWVASSAEPLRLQAQAARERGDLAAASATLREALARDERFEAARLDLIDVLIDAGELAEAGRMLEDLEFRARDRDRVAALKARLQLVEGASAGVDAAALERRIAADPDDLEARLALANVLGLEQKFRPAMEQLMEIIRRDRSYADDAARKTLVQLFSLCPDDDLVRSYRSQLASAINA